MSTPNNKNSVGDFEEDAKYYDSEAETQLNLLGSSINNNKNNNIHNNKDSDKKLISNNPDESNNFNINRQETRIEFLSGQNDIGRRLKQAKNTRRIKLPLKMMKKLNMFSSGGPGNKVYYSSTGNGNHITNSATTNNNSITTTTTTTTTSNGNQSRVDAIQIDVNKALSELADEADDGLQVLESQRNESKLSVSLKLMAIFSTIYFFMWSSSILSQAFNLVSYHYAGNFIRTSGFLQNPLIGLMVGVITTVIFQSSGAVTSVLVTIVGSGVLTVRQSIPIIMGANLGTSVTNTVVSLIVYRKKSNFEIAMTAGIVHDMYNMMSVVFMLPIELLLHPLEHSSIWMLGLFSSTKNSNLNLYNSTTTTTTSDDSEALSSSMASVQFLSYLVKPLVDLVIMIDKDITSKLEPNIIVPSDVSLVKRCCNSERRGNETICHELCFSLFSHFEFSDSVVCVLLSIIAMTTLFTCLIFVVKVTKSLLGGKLLNWVARLARKEYNYPYKLFVGYLFILVGLIITAILHSSGVFTSMLVPLAGGEVLSLMQIYELTLGSNVGTTTTGILAALSAQSKYPNETLQVALCHFLFNLAGILMFYTFPHTKLPIWASKRFGMLSARNMWFSIAYLVLVFLVAPALTMFIYFATTTSSSNNQHY